MRPMFSKTRRRRAEGIAPEPDRTNEQARSFSDDSRSWRSGQPESQESRTEFTEPKTEILKAGNHLSRHQASTSRERHLRPARMALDRRWSLLSRQTVPPRQRAQAPGRFPAQHIMDLLEEAAGRSSTVRRPQGVDHTGGASAHRQGWTHYATIATSTVHLNLIVNRHRSSTTRHRAAGSAKEFAGSSSRTPRSEGLVSAKQVFPPVGVRERDSTANACRSALHLSESSR